MENILVSTTEKAKKSLLKELGMNNIEFELDRNTFSLSNSPKVRMALQMVRERCGMQSYKVKTNH